MVLCIVDSQWISLFRTIFFFSYHHNMNEHSDFCFLLFNWTTLIFSKSVTFFVFLHFPVPLKKIYISNSLVIKSFNIVSARIPHFNKFADDFMNKQTRCANILMRKVLFSHFYLFTINISLKGNGFSINLVGLFHSFTSSDSFES